MATAVFLVTYALMSTAGLTASCAFMLPVAVHPNRNEFGSGYLRIPDMTRAGFWLNTFSIVIITIVIYFYLPCVWGIDITDSPDAFRK
ncbi:anion permease [Pseudalkalibacillus caeni]|uniref:anion permease n=1 Tax=Exobacillus caeni TaxID=2574798 RepID=UPI001FE3DFC7|nr:anion permease [Pseudalkalibacillus caeni]